MAHCKLKIYVGLGGGSAKYPRSGPSLGWDVYILSVLRKSTPSCMFHCTLVCVLSLRR